MPDCGGTDHQRAIGNRVGKALVDIVEQRDQRGIDIGLDLGRDAPVGSPPQTPFSPQETLAGGV